MLRAAPAQRGGAGGEGLDAREGGCGGGAFSRHHHHPLHGGGSGGGAGPGGGGAAAHRQLLVQLAVAVAYAGFTLGALRVRSWRFRHKVSFKLLNTSEIEGIRELVQSDDQDEEGSEIDSLLSPFSRDLLVGIQVDGDVVGIDTVNMESGQIGYLEEVKLARQFWGYGLEHLLRYKTLEVVRRPPPELRGAATVSTVRQLVFAWNARARALCETTGMDEIARWSYHVADAPSKAVALVGRVERACASLGPLPPLHQVSRVSKMLAVLQRTTQRGLLLQYWDIYDVRRHVLVSLFSGVLANSPRHRDSDRGAPGGHDPTPRGEREASIVRQRHEYSSNDSSDDDDDDDRDGAASCASREDPTLPTRGGPHDRTPGGSPRFSSGSDASSPSLSRNAASDEDLLGPEDLPRTLHVRNCVMQCAELTCSVGELIDRDAPLGSLCTFTIYCDASDMARRSDVCKAEALAHIRYWAQLGVDTRCQSIAMFCDPALHGALADVVDLKPASQLILFESSFR